MRLCRQYYFLGKVFSYTLTGLLAAEVSAVLHVALKPYHLSEILMLLFVGDAWGVLGNGFAFSLLTSRSLFLAFYALPHLVQFKKYDRGVIGGSPILVGGLGFCRGIAEALWTLKLSD